MKSLFNKYEAYNTDGNKISVEIQDVLEPIFEKWVKKGYKTNDIELIAISTTSTISAITRLEISMKEIKQERIGRSVNGKPIGSNPMTAGSNPVRPE